jgi:L-rhamnose-H+ transport protein
MANPLFGLIYHWIGGIAAASFYIPYRGVRRWSWETYWLTGGIFSWILAPTIFALLLVPHAWDIVLAAKPTVLAAAFFFGAMWGIGGLTFGLTMRYLGIALGMAVALGFCTVFGTLVPPIFHQTFMSDVVDKPSGRIILLGVVTTVIGIAISGLAGMSKEKEVPDEKKRGSTKEFNFGKGMLIAMFSGIMSSCMAFGLDAGKPITAATASSLVAGGNLDIWQGLPVLIVILLGGFSTNFLWCLFLNIRNKTGSEYLAVPEDTDHLHNATLQVSAAMSTDEALESSVATMPVAVPVNQKRSQLLVNYGLCALAGTTWYLQFFFYTMGQAKLGKNYDFSNFTLHMASIIIFSTLWGIYLHEWSGISTKTKLYVGLGLAILVGSTVVIGYGNYVDQHAVVQAAAALSR